MKKSESYYEETKFERKKKLEELSRLKKDDHLPSFSDLKGICPNFTGDLSSEDFVREGRNID